MKTTIQTAQFRDPMEAAIYVRVPNGDRSRSGVSEEAQVELAEAYLRSRKLRGSHVFREEGVSASTPLASRPAGARLLELVEAGVVKHIVAMNLDRLFRSAEDALRMTHKWARQGVTLHLLDSDGRAMDTSADRPYSDRRGQRDPLTNPGEPAHSPDQVYLRKHRLNGPKRISGPGNFVALTCSARKE